MSWRQFWGDEVLPQLRRVGKALGAAGAEDSKDEKIQGSMAQSVLLAVRSLVHHAFEIRKPASGR